MDAKKAAADKKLKFKLIFGFVIIIMQSACGITTPQQTSSGITTPQQTHSGIATPQQTSSGIATPQQTSSGIATPQQTSSGITTPQQTHSGIATPQQTSSGITTPQQSHSEIATPQQTSNSGKIAYQVWEKDNTVEDSHIWMVNGNSNKLTDGYSLIVWMMDADGSNQVRVSEKDAGFLWSRDGKHIFITYSGAPSYSVFEVDTGLVQNFEADTSGQVPIPTIPDHISKPLSLWSPDGKFVSWRWSAGSENFDIWVYDGSSIVQLTNSPANDWYPQWSPDGSRIAFQSDFVESVEGAIWVMNADGGNLLQLTDFPGIESSLNWSPDSSKIVFVRDGGIWLVNADGSGILQLTNGNNLDPTWSPDGSKIAYTANQNGSLEIWVMDADGSNQVQLTDNTIHLQMGNWSPDSRQIVFTSNDQIFRIDVDGNNLVQLTDHKDGARNPQWQPAP